MMRGLFTAQVLGLAICVSTTAHAEIRFTPLPNAIPEHVYDGGWEHFVGGGLAVFDCNRDGRPDMFAAGGENPAILLQNDGDFDFAQIDIGDIRGTTGAYPIDINADGWSDLYVMRVGPDLVLKGGPDCAFSDATLEWGIPQSDGWTTAFTAWWEDDTRPVMAIGRYVDRENEDGPFGACDTNAILRPDVDGYMTEVLKPGHCALSMLAGPDARGRHTLRISNDRHYYIRDGQEQLWDINEQRFLGDADGWPKLMLWGMGIASTDLTGDGADEVMLTSMGDQMMQLALPDGTYEAAPFGIGTYAHRPHIGDDGRPSTGWHAQFGDINNDARPDLFIAKGNVDQMPSNAMNDPNNLLVQNAQGTFDEQSEGAGVADTARSRGATLADFDGDGRLDLAVVNRRAPMRIYRNVGETAHWVAVSLTQAGGNHDAIGAAITVNGSVQYLRIGGGHAGGSALPLHFGIGDAQRAEISVTWPDGTTTQITADAGQTVSIEKPDT
jgi:hypothetical protein